MANDTKPTYTCRKCGWTWTPRPKQLAQGRTEPANCPRCRSRNWK